LNQLPVLPKFILVCQSLLRNQSENAGRQVAAKDGNRIDADLCFMLSITDVKMRGLMIAVEHGNDDTKKAANLWHTITFTQLER